MMKAAITDWWVSKYDLEIGLLHKVKWHRIILDGKYPTLLF